jgi:hypothetical protein
MSAIEQNTENRHLGRLTIGTLANRPAGRGTRILSNQDSDGP